MTGSFWGCRSPLHHYLCADSMVCSVCESSQSCLYTYSRGTFQSVCVILYFLLEGGGEEERKKSYFAFQKNSNKTDILLLNRNNVSQKTMESYP
jgi:hypothetical protein